MRRHASLAVGLAPVGLTFSIGARARRVPARSALPSLPRQGSGTTVADTAPLPATAPSAILAIPRIKDGLCPILGAIAAAVALGLAFLAS